MNRGKRGSRLSGGHGALAVEFADGVIAQKLVRLLGSVQILQPQLLRKPTLPGPEVTFAPSPGLWRVSRGYPDAEISHRWSDFGHLACIHGAAPLWVCERSDWHDRYRPN